MRTIDPAVLRDAALFHIDTHLDVLTDRLKGSYSNPELIRAEIDRWLDFRNAVAENTPANAG